MTGGDGSTVWLVSPLTRPDSRACSNLHAWVSFSEGGSGQRPGPGGRQPRASALQTRPPPARCIGGTRQQAVPTPAARPRSLAAPLPAPPALRASPSHPGEFLQYSVGFAAVLFKTLQWLLSQCLGSAPLDTEPWSSALTEGRLHGGQPGSPDSAPQSAPPAAEAAGTFPSRPGGCPCRSWPGPHAAEQAPGSEIAIAEASDGFGASGTCVLRAPGWGPALPECPGEQGPCGMCPHPRREALWSRPTHTGLSGCTAR